MTNEERKIALEKLNQDKKRKMQSLERLLAEDKDKEILEKLEKNSKTRSIFLIFLLVVIFGVDYYFFPKNIKDFYLYLIFFSFSVNLYANYEVIIPIKSIKEDKKTKLWIKIAYISSFIAFLISLIFFIVIYKRYDMWLYCLGNALIPPFIIFFIIVQKYNKKMKLKNDELFRREKL